MALLLSSPLWMVLIAVTLGIHVAFFVAIRRLQRRDAERLRDRDPPPH